MFHGHPVSYSSTPLLLGLSGGFFPLVLLFFLLCVSWVCYRSVLFLVDTGIAPILLAGW